MTEESIQSMQQAVGQSFLSGFPEGALAQLLAESRLVRLPAGASSVNRRDLPQAALVIDGLVRLFLASPDGRQVTVRYARAGATLGVVALTAGGFTPVHGQTLAETSLLALNPVTLRSLAQQDARIAWAMSEEMSRVLISILNELAANAFGTVRQKLALHLLGIATGEAGPPVAAVSQQDLANAIGSVREVVARTISEFGSLGLVRATRGGIVLLDAAGLHQVAWNTDTSEKPGDLV